MPTTYQVEQPTIQLREYWLECLVLFIAIAIPVFVALVWRTGDAFERSGSLTVFFSVVAEFITVNRLTKKHVLNACRARNDETPWNVSAAAQRVGIAAFTVGLVGTLIWGFGSKVWA